MMTGLVSMLHGTMEKQGKVIPEEKFKREKEKETT